MNHKLYNEGDKELGFNKMLFMLLFGMIRQYRNRPRFYAYLDERTTKHTPDRLRRMLNAKAVSSYRITHNPYRVCQFRNSEDVRMIQLVDVICGAISYSVNQLHLTPNAAAAKTALMHHIAACAKVTSLSIKTTRKDEGFDLWHIDLAAYAKGVRRT